MLVMKVRMNSTPAVSVSLRVAGSVNAVEVWCEGMSGVLVSGEVYGVRRL
jgi:hypothetical protein